MDEIYFLIVFFVLAAGLLFAAINTNVYCAVFLRKERKLWKRVIELANEYSFDRIRVTDDPDGLEFKAFFSHSEPNIIVFTDMNKHYAYVFSAKVEDDGHVKVGKCILSHFDKKYSKKAYDAVITAYTTQQSADDYRTTTTNI